jgi:hypothetical protein
MLVAAQAQAAIVTLTWTGTVSSGADTLFGDLGANLAGDDFTAVFTFDTSEGLLNAYTAPLGSGVSLSGGAVEGLPTYSSPGTATLMVNGQTANFSGSEGSDYFAQYDGSGGIEYGVDVFQSSPGFVFTMITDGVDNPGKSLNTPYSGSVCDTSCMAMGAGLVLSPTHLNVAIDGSFDNPTLGVPEPSTWAMMLLGAAPVGGLLRSRRLRPA